MDNTIRSLVVTLLIAGVAGCGGGNDGPPEPAAEPAEETVEETDAGPGADGRTVFANNCATCHGDDGAGAGPAAVGLEPPPPDLTDATWTTGDGSIAAIRNIVVNGSPGTAMIAWKGTLTEAEIDAVSAYVHEMGGGQ